MEAIEKIRVCKNNLVCDYGFFAQLLLTCNFKEVTDKSLCPTLCTDGNNIYFNTDFVNMQSVNELGFIIMHEVMHCALGHLWRRDTRDARVWNLATDYAINIMLDNIAKAYFDKNTRGMGGGNSTYKPLVFEIKRSEEVLYEPTFAGKSAEEIYNILIANSDCPSGNNQITIFGNFADNNSNDNNSNDSNSNDNEESNSNNEDTSANNSANNSQPKRRRKSKQSNNNSSSQPSQPQKWWLKQNSDGTYSGNLYEPQNHGMWKNADELSDNEKRKNIKKWEERMLVADEIMKKAGIGEAGFERVINNLKHPQKNWRMLLHDFIQEEINDYSWSPPDKRYDGDFFLCDYNDTVEAVKDMLFFVDTSGSMSPSDLNMCFSEIQGAINQFNNHLKGTLLFFDYNVKPKYYDFDDVDGDISKLSAFGGGGTSYECIFKFLDKHQSEFDNVNGIIILTDGECDYPEEAPAVPLLWIYTQQRSDIKPPYGLFTHLETNYDLSD